ncbi:MAG TPA: hypothetical protein VN663_23155 [Ramlibacter sp.]|nr:hypothetical protein [Ramlibacter sp.]
MNLRIGLFIIAALLLGAYFLRLGNLILAALCLCAPMLLLYQKRWVLIVLQLLAYGAAALWVTLAARLVEFRLQSGQPWKLAAIILGAVALFTLLAGLLLNSRSVRERYPLQRRD